MVIDFKIFDKIVSTNSSKKLPIDQQHFKWTNDS
jgi:hypothetical protein